MRKNHESLVSLKGLLDVIVYSFSSDNFRAAAVVNSSLSC